ncbi:MAG TPA: hypothetical protein DCO83_05940 [Mucilaginibacter sp.]|nr:hypothetical protein [Mucilaginibacter sp.]
MRLAVWASEYSLSVVDIATFTALAIIGGILAANVLSSTGIGIYFIVLGLMLLFYDLVCETFF